MKMRKYVVVVELEVAENELLSVMVDPDDPIEVAVFVDGVFESYKRANDARIDADCSKVKIVSPDTTLADEAEEVANRWISKFEAVLQVGLPDGYVGDIGDFLTARYLDLPWTNPLSDLAIAAVLKHERWDVVKREWNSQFPNDLLDNPLTHEQADKIHNI